MGSSYTEYRERGFWAGDAHIEMWLYFLSEEAAHVSERPAWLDAAQDHWRLHATMGFVGFVSACLDEHVGVAPDRVATVIALSERARARLARWAPAIPRDLANRFGTGGEGSYFTGDVDTEPLLKVADAFVALLRGEITGEPGTVWAY
ncbi:hypothetical protein [Streptomyces milbemycinicus]|uniref:Uncharacterized protein n=1 Tax=Streptomyces milbemycinicus TaxID=476552 RepID=A0ABW8LG36_9ACTN